MDADDELRAVVTPTPGGASLKVRVIPRSGQSVFAGIRDGALLVRLAAAPVDGAANDALTAFLADELNLPRRSLQIETGSKNRIKRIKVVGVSVAGVMSRLTVRVPDR